MDDRTADRGDRPQRPSDADPETVTTTVLPVDAGAEGPPASDAGEQAGPAGAPHGMPGLGFPVVLRGYERHNVETAFAELRADLDAATARYEAAEAALTAARSAVAELQQRAAAADEQARRTGAELEALRNERDGRIPPKALAERIQRMLELAEEEAAEIRATAQADAERQRAAAREEVDRLGQRRDQLNSELAALHARITALLQGSQQPPG